MSKRNTGNQPVSSSGGVSPPRSAGNLPAKRSAGYQPAKQPANPIAGLYPDRITNEVSATTYKPGFSRKGTERSRNAVISDAMFQKELKAYREQQAKKYSKEPK